jgi:hypothetical protein
LAGWKRASLFVRRIGDEEKKVLQRLNSTKTTFVDDVQCVVVVVAKIFNRFSQKLLCIHP